MDGIALNSGGSNFDKTKWLQNIGEENFGKFYQLESSV